MQAQSVLEKQDVKLIEKIEYVGNNLEKKVKFLEKKLV